MKNSQPDFKPHLTPLQIIKLGGFGGFYFGKKLPKNYPDTWKKSYGSPTSKDITANAFKVDSGISLEQWQASGWIHEQDPLGWLQWYCQYNLGRRTEDDARQIARWRAYTRHYQPVLKKGEGDINKRRVQRQSLLHWGYDPVPDFPQIYGESLFEKIKRVLKTQL